MKLNEYQKEAMKTAIFRRDVAELYIAAALAGEAGEVANIIKKAYREGTNKDVYLLENRERIKEELGDVLWYCAALAEELLFNLEDVASENIEKLRKRHG